MDFKFSNLNEIVKDSKKLFMCFWRLSRSGTNHPSIAQRGVSCSKVDLGEPESSKRTIFKYVLKTYFEVTRSF